MKRVMAAHSVAVNFFSWIYKQISFFIMAYVSKFRCDMYNLAKCNKQFHSTTIQKLLQNFGSQWFI